MKVVNVSLPDPHFQAVLDQARTENVIVQLGDGSEFLLAAIDDFDREVAATAKERKVDGFSRSPRSANRTLFRRGGEAAARTELRVPDRLRTAGLSND